MISKYWCHWPPESGGSIGNDLLSKSFGGRGGAHHFDESLTSESGSITATSSLQKSLQFQFINYHLVEIQGTQRKFNQFFVIRLTESKQNQPDLFQLIYSQLVRLSH